MTCLSAEYDDYVACCKARGDTPKHHTAFDLGGWVKSERRAQWVLNRRDEIAVRVTSLSKTEAQKRKEAPVCTGAIDYFPTALTAVGRLSRIGNEQHNPGTELHWDRAKSGDEADALVRHLIDRRRNPIDTDGVPHVVKVAWRALALAEKYLEENPWN